jgi:sulfate permease, SulP family
MIVGTVGEMAGGDTSYYAQIASLTGFVVALLCLIAWLLRLSGLVTLISDSILVGFKAGAALTIAMTQLPNLLGVAGGGHNFFEWLVLLVPQLAVGVIAIVLLVLSPHLWSGSQLLE